MVDYLYDTVTTLTANASAWIASASNTYFAPRITVTNQLDSLDTLVTLILERKVREILLGGASVERSITPLPHRLFLFC